MDSLKKYNLTVQTEQNQNISLCMGTTHGSALYLFWIQILLFSMKWIKSGQCKRHPESFLCFD